MKKPSPQARRLQIRRDRKKKNEERRAAGMRRESRLRRSRLNIQHHEYYELKESRRLLRHKVYKRKSYKDDRLIIAIDHELGLEEDLGAEAFLEKASSFIDFNAKELVFDISNCTRIWPSAIVLLCSLEKWVEMTSTKEHLPRLASSSSKDMRVNSYLAESGFYDYVKREKDATEKYFSSSEIVKLRRETTPSNIEERESEIVALLKQYSNFSEEDIEKFDAKILTEAFNNITEHGVNFRDRGWWVLAQYHPTHKIISLCFADNGIGIRNSLMTGPQKGPIGTRIRNTPANDGEFIKLAIEETVSGALEAPFLEGRKLKTYSSGARRGNGLKRICRTCEELHIPFSILSHHGYVFIGPDGKLNRVGSNNGRVFAGTMYHFVIPTN